MLKFNLNNKGLTLLEVLVVVIIAAGIMILTTSIYIQALNNNERILQEAKLREEADYLMSLLVKEFYTLKKSSIIVDLKNSSEDNTIRYKVPYSTAYDHSLNSCSVTLNECTVVTGFKTINNQTNLYIKGQLFAPLNTDITISNKSLISKPNKHNFQIITPSYEVKLTLVNKKKLINNEITFKNEIAIINN